MILFGIAGRVNAAAAAAVVDDDDRQETDVLLSNEMIG